MFVAKQDKYSILLIHTQVQVFDDTEATDPTAQDMCIGSRPHESEEAFLHFLDMLYAVCFHKTLDAEKEHGSIKPLLPPYANQVKANYMV